MNSSQNTYGQQPPAPPLHQTVSYSSQSNHQLPQTPQSQNQRPGARPTSKSGFSFHSHKSKGSSEGVPKMDMTESPAEKRARRLSTKADPRMAMSEAEPSQLANDHSSVLAPLRAMQHKDWQGNPIADPDRSNPTRSRWERPLDTIRAFEAAIDGNYERKARPGVPDSRRTSAYGGSTVGAMKSYQGNGYSGGGGSRGGQNGSDGYGYYNGRGSGYQSRPDSYYSNNDNNNGYYPNRQRFPQRQGSEPMLNNGYGNGVSSPSSVYPPNGNPQSYDTASGSSSDQMTYGTDPSSDNSSFDRGYNSYPQQTHGSGYPQGAQQPQYDEGSPDRAYQGDDYGNPAQGRPAPPPKMDSGAQGRAPMKLGKAAPGQQAAQFDGYGAPVNNDKEDKKKKKGWLGRRFSKRE